MPASYTVLVDWDNDGAYTSAGEDVTLRVVEAEPITIERGRDQARALAPPMAGSAALSLDNRSRDYSPENAASPLAGKLLPGRRVRVRAVDGATNVDLFTGILEDLPQVPERALPRVTLPALGMLSRLAGKHVSTELFTNITTDVALGKILDAVGWPTAERSFQVGKTTLKYWWLDDRDAFDAAVELINTEGPGATLYEDGRGYAVFESRHYRIQTLRANTPQATFRDAGITPAFSKLAYNPGLRDVVNSVSVPVNMRVVQPLAEVWALGQDLVLGAGQSTYIVASDQGGNPIRDAVTPAAGTDYTVTAGALASVTLARTSGASVTLYITADAAGVTLAGLRLRAVAIKKVAGIRVSNTIDTTQSRADYGTHTYEASTWPEIDVNVAQDFANAIAGAYQQPRPVVRLLFQGADAAMLTQALVRDVSDRITVIDSVTGLNHDVHIESIKHTIGDGGRQHSVQFGCERVSDAAYAAWGSARWGSNVWAF